MSNKITNEFAKWSKECKTILEKESSKVEALIEKQVEQFQKHTLDNIPQQFGTFLYTALGDRVTGQRSSVINTTFFEKNEEGQKLIKEAKEANLDIETYISKKQKEMHEASKTSYWNRRHFRSSDKIQAYITAGRKFGISYPTTDGDRIHTTYFGAGMCFSYLTQEHVECVKNKLKKQCVQDFLTFRDDYMAGIKRLNNIVPVTIPVKAGMMYNIAMTKKFTDRFSDDNRHKTYVILDGDVDEVITHVMFILQAPTVWNKYDHVGIIATNETVKAGSYISMLFLNINEDDKKIIVLGNMDIDLSKVSHVLQIAYQDNNTSIIHHSPEYEQTYDGHIKNAPDAYKDYTSETNNGIILNFSSIFTNHIVVEELNKRIKFFNDMSERLQQLKHSNASLYFINSDF